MPTQTAAAMESPNPRTGGSAVDRISDPKKSPLVPKTPTSSSSFQKAVCLDDWWLVKADRDCDGKRLAIGGMEAKRQQAARVFLSSPVIKRHDTFTLETADGVTIIIQGLINRSRTNQNGFTPEACNRFLTGFPYNWEVYANKCFGEESMTPTTPASGSSFVGLLISSANKASSVAGICSNVIPMCRILERLISSHGTSDNDIIKRSNFAEIRGACAADAARNHTMQEDPLMETPIMHETTKSHQKLNKCAATGVVASSDKDTVNGELESIRKVLSSEESNNPNHGSCVEPKNDVLGVINLSEKSGSPSSVFLKQADQVQEAANRINAIPSEKQHISKKRPSNFVVRRSSNRLKYLNQTVQEDPHMETPIMPETTKSHQKCDKCTATGEATSSDKDTMNGEQESVRKVLSLEGVNNGNHASYVELKNDVLGQINLSAKSGSPSNAFLNQVDQVQAAANRRKAIQSEKQPISKKCPNNFLLRRSSNRLKYLKNNLKGEKTPDPEGSVGIENEKNEFCTMSVPVQNNVGSEVRKGNFFSTKADDANLECPMEPEGSFFSGESGYCSSVEKTPEQLKKLKKNSTLFEGEMGTSKVIQSNSDCRRSSIRLKKAMRNLKEDEVTEFSLDMEQKDVTTVLPVNSFVGNGINNVENLPHRRSAEDKAGLEEGMHVVSLKKYDNGYSEHRLQMDSQSSQSVACNQNGLFCPSVQCNDAEPENNSHSSAKLQQNNDKEKGKHKKNKKRMVVNQPVVTRDRAKKLTIVSPDSLNCKRSRSGRLIVPALANWRNQQPVYDLDGNITGIALGYDRTLLCSGSKLGPA